jgi:hypothetical protein
MNAITETTNWKRCKFSDFYPVKSPQDGPGWFVFGRNATEYGVTPDGKGAYVKLCAWQDRPKRKYPGYNVRTVAGWPTKREAQAVADSMNQTGA